MGYAFYMPKNQTALAGFVLWCLGAMVAGCQTVQTGQTRAPAAAKFSDAQFVSASNLEDLYFSHWPESFKEASLWVHSIRDAIVPLNSANVGKHCGSVVVSRSGYALTAQHCIPQKAQTLEQFSYARGFETATVILKGSSSSLFDGTGRFPTARSSDSEIRAYRNGYYDWALVKFPDTAKGYTCVPVTRDRMVNEPVIHLGYPNILNSQLSLNPWPLLHSPYGLTEAHMPREMIEMSKKMYVARETAMLKGEPWAIRMTLPLIATTGFSYQNGAEAVARGAYFFAGTNYKSDELDRILDPRSYFASSAAGTNGMSGGPVLSANRRAVVGITVLGNAIAPYSVLGLPPGTYAVSSDAIVSAVIKQLGQERARTVFDCP